MITNLYYFLNKVNEENLKTIGRMFPQWVTLHFGGNSVALVALITHLILKSTRGPKALDVLMMGCKKWKGVLGLNLRNLLGKLINYLIVYRFIYFVITTFANIPDR